MDPAVTSIATGVMAVLMPYYRMLQFQGLINGFQPFVLGITIQGQQPNGFYGFGTDACGYYFNRR